MRKKILICGYILLQLQFIYAQLSTVNYSTTGSVYYQSFDGLSGSATAIVLATPAAVGPAGPFDFSATPASVASMQGWQVYRITGNSSTTQIVGGTGTSTAGSFYSFGNASTNTERALGIGCASTYSAAGVGVVITNNTGSTLTSFTIGFTGEQWRYAGIASANTWAFKYAIGASSAINDISNGTFTNNTTLNFASPIIGVGTAAALDGNNATNQTSKSLTITGITWANGDKLVIRWDDARIGTGNQNHNSIDNFYFTASASSTYLWNGGTSTDYTDATNWTPNRSTVTVNDILQINANSATSITNIPLQNIAGLVVAGTNLLTLQGVNSSSNLTIDNNCTILNGSTLTLGSNAKITIGNAAKLSVAGTFNTNGSVVLASNATSTAMVASSSGTISGNVNMQRYIQGGYRAFRFLAHPFNATIPLSQLTSTIDITGNANDAGGFTATTTNNPSAFWYNAATPDWSAFSQASNTIAKWQGIRLLIRGAKGEGLNGETPVVSNPTGGQYTPSAVTLNLTGALNTGTQTIPLTYTNATNTYNLVGNPYASPIDMNNVTGNNIASTYSVWNPSTWSIAAKGAYETRNFANTSYILPAGAAFMVQATGTGSTITFNETNKSQAAPAIGLLSSSNIGIAKEEVFNNNKQQFITLAIKENAVTIDRLSIYFKENATANTDYWDGLKYANPGLNFFSYATDGYLLSIDSRPLAVNSKEQNIQLGLTTTAKIQFTITAENIEMPNTCTLVLHDKQLNTFTAITPQLQYTFTVTNDSASQGNRFEIIQKTNSTGNIANAITTNEFAATLLNANFINQLHIKISNKAIGEANQIKIVNQLGQEVKNINTILTNNSETIIVNTATLKSGIYFIQVSNNSNSITLKAIKI